MKNTRVFLIGFILFLLPNFSAAQRVWVPDREDGTYRNPVLFADYSDPDVIRTGDDYYLVASSFTCMPGIPVLHSKDLVNWKIINHVYDTLPFDRYRFPAHGQGSWAPAIRYHNGVYYVYFCTPEEGLFVARTTDPAKKWKLHQMVHVTKWEDPCPFWDEDGNAYLVHSIHRGGPAVLHRMSPDGLKLLDNGVVVYHDEKENPVLEGLKMMKRDGWYYILAPAGGVATGWQTVLRSRNIYGPYESRRVLAQGNTEINGPHQGGLVETQAGEWWFLHFQDRGPYGRVAHLQPAAWKDGWPVMGTDPDGDGCGEPVSAYRKPNVGAVWPVEVPRTSDEFDPGNGRPGLQWQWQAAERPQWYSLREREGWMRLYAEPCPTERGNLYYAGNLLLQKLPAPEFTAATKVEADFTTVGEQAGLVMMGNAYSCICIRKTETGNRISLYEGRYDRLAVVPEETAYAPQELPAGKATVWFRVRVRPDATCTYAYSIDGTHYTEFDRVCKLTKGGWIGAKTGIYCASPNVVRGEGHADFDWFRLEKE